MQVCSQLSELAQGPAQSSRELDHILRSDHHIGDHQDQGQFAGSKPHTHSSPGFRRNRIAATAITNTIRPTGRIPTIHSTAVGT